MDRDILYKLIFDSKFRASWLGYHGFYNYMSDEKYLKALWKRKRGTELNLDNPKQFSEKLQWLKLNDRNPYYTKLVDKSEVKKIVRNQLGEEYIIPTLYEWESADDIDFDILPNQFVLKCTHNSGGVCVCEDKDKLDRTKVRSMLRKQLRRNYYYSGREWPYKNVKPRIIAEQYMVNEETGDLPDYKFMCFNGRVECIFVMTERHSLSGVKITIFDKKWNVLPFERVGHPRSEVPIKKPDTLNKMIEMAESMSREMAFVRIDFYEINKKIFFGEYTFYPASGIQCFTPDSVEYELGELLDIGKVKVRR